MIYYPTQATMENSSFSSSNAHVPVMVDEVVRLLSPQAGGIYVDGTLGLGGHTKAIISRIGAKGRVIGLDRDQDALKYTKTNLGERISQCELIHSDFRNIDKVLKDLGVEKVNGILLDLGISSFQLDNPSRGFSFRSEGPLDMRMDQSAYISAFDLVNSLSENELSMILKNFGEERWHQKIAKLIVEARNKEPIKTTRELCDVILQAVSFARHYNFSDIHPATRTFQALRIAVNRELEALELTIEKCIDLLEKSGRLVVISFHSLEDRIVKNKFRQWEAQHRGETLTKKPLRPSPVEVESNSRSRSARVRAFERT